MQRHRSWFVGVVAGLVVGAAVALFVGAVTSPTRPAGAVNFWSLVFGVPAGLAAGFAAAAFATPTRSRGARIGTGVVLLLFGVVVLWWNVMWGIPLATPEGAWLWPLAIGPVLLGGGLLLTARQRPV